MDDTVLINPVVQAARLLPPVALDSFWPAQQGELGRRALWAVVADGGWLCQQPERPGQLQWVIDSLV